MHYNNPFLLRVNRTIPLLLARPKTLLFGIAALSLLALVPAFHIKADFDLEGFYPDDADTIVEYQRIADEFGRDDTGIIVAFRNDSLFTERHLLRVRDLASDLKSVPHVDEIISIWNSEDFVNHNGSLQARPWLTENILEDEFEIERVRLLMLEDPFILGTLLGSNGTATAVYLRINEESNTFSNRRELIAGMNEVLDPYRSHYDFNISGLPYFRTQYIETLNREILFYVSAASLLIIFILWMLFRTLIGVLLPISIVWVTILFVTAILVMTGGFFEILSSTVAPILLCVGVADSVHMLSKYQDLRLLGNSRQRSLKQMIIILGSATLLTSITTAIGFLTLVTSNVMPMRRFGLYTAAGVIIAFVVTMIVLPSVLQLLRDKTPIADKSRFFFQKIGALLSGLHHMAHLHYKTIVIATLLVTFAFSYGITRLKINSKVFDDIGEQSELIQQSRFLDNYLAPQFPLEIVIDTGSEDGVYDPGLLQRIDLLQNHLLEFEEIEQSVSYTTLMKRIDRVMRDQPDDTLPDSRSLIAQYDLLLELTGSTGAAALADFEKRQTRIIARVYDAGSYNINRMRDRLEEYFEDHFPDETVLLTGSTILSADLTGNIVRALTWSIGLAFLFISLIMSILFRSGKLVVISLLPNLIPLLVTAGFMGYAGIDIRPSTAVIFTIAFGIAVDDSIHYLARFRMETLQGNSLHDAVRNTTIHTGRAIILTSLILLAGFGVLGTSSFESNMLMGLLTCLTILTALIADLFFLPALIYWMNPQVISQKEVSPNAQGWSETFPPANGKNQLKPCEVRGKLSHQNHQIPV